MTEFDLGSYLRRIGVEGPVAPDFDTLRRIHLAHLGAIPFENLDIHLGRPIRLDIGSIVAKLVHGERGGYCFEQNALLGTALAAIGFRLGTLGARVGPGDPRTLRRTHMILAVTVEGSPDVLADVGFGAGSIYEPIPLLPGPEVTQYGRTFRVRQTADGLAFERRDGQAWVTEYQYTLEPMYPGDYEVANWFTSTSPESKFVQTITAQRDTPDGQAVLRGHSLTLFRDGHASERRVTDDELVDVLAEHFGLKFPPGTRFVSPAVVQPPA